MTISVGRSVEYINDFLYFVLKPDQSRGQGAYLYCSGVDLYRFLPITKGRHRPMSNPVMRGLQLVNVEVRALALSQGAIPKAISGEGCTGLVPPSNGWYKEMLLIENAPESLPDEIIRYCVVNILKKTFRAILLPEDELPATFLQPDQLRDFIESLCKKYGG